MLSEDAKAIVASNLVVANAIIYQEYSKQGREKPGTGSQEVTEKWFKEFLLFLDQTK